MQLHRLNYAFIKRLKKTVYGYSKIIYGDLDKAIKVGLNYLAALGLSTYSEVLGGLCYGNLLSNYNANYDRFIKILVIQSVLPLMRRQRDGTIVNIGSIGGRIAFPFSPFYASTKFAMEGLSEALRYEVAQFGIKVILVEPGLIKTNFFENVKKPKRTEDSPYHQLVQKGIDRVKGILENGTTAEEVAKVIFRAAISSKEEHDLRYMVGSDAESVMEKRKKMTDREFFDFMYKNILDTAYN